MCGQKYQKQGLIHESMGFPNNQIIVIIRVDANKSGTITPQELQAALVNGNGTEFNMTTINMMIGD